MEPTHQEAHDARVLSNLGYAYDTIAERIRTESELHRALRLSTELSDLLRELAKASADLRARVANQILRSDPMSYASLGKVLGVSMGRAAQLIARYRKNPDDPASSRDPVSE